MGTRGMAAGGATKGAVDRELLHLAMTGCSRIQHEMKVWQAKGTMASLDLAAASVHLVLPALPALQRPHVTSA
eukprot:12203779-Alexandrium_andersonii.AAC.1